MAHPQRLLWGRHGIYALLNKNTSFTSKRERVLEALHDAFGLMSDNDGALIFALTTQDATLLFKLADQAERYANNVLSDPNANIQEIAWAYRLKFQIGNTRMYLMMRDDFEEIFNSARKLDEKWKEVISPIIQRHLESGALDKEDLAEGLLD